MTPGSFKRIAATCPQDAYFGRADELGDILNTGTEGVFVGSAPGDGASELVRQAYDRMFFSAGKTIPFYFPFKEKSESRIKTARRFLYQLIVQTIAFRHGDPNIIHTLPTLDEIVKMTSLDDDAWIEPLIKLYSDDEDEEVFVNSCFSSPFRAVATGVRLIVFIDDIHFSPATAELLAEHFYGSGIKYIFAGRRRYDMHLKDAKRIILRPFEGKEGAEFVRSLSKRTGVEITDSTADLIVGQMNGNLRNIESIFSAARVNSVDLKTYKDSGSVYIDEMFNGSIRKYYDSMLDRCLGSDASRSETIEFLWDLYEHPSESETVEDWRRRTSIGKKEFEKLISRLHKNEFLDLNFGRIYPIENNAILKDQIGMLYRLEVEGEREAIVFTDVITHQLKRAPKLMSAIYRRSAAIGLKNILSTFDSQTIPTALLDFGRFRSEYQGMSDIEITERLQTETQILKLPQIVYSTFTEDIYSQIAKISLKERSAAGIGFYGGTFDEESEIVWIAAEVDSKLEASKELTEFWCDRLEMAALMGNYVSYRLWLVSSGGFSPEALEVLENRNSFGSNRKQVELLTEWLNITPKNSSADISEYEITIPMTDESELISANALEEIAKRHKFEPKTINQIKTALIEACINAAEHGLSPDGKIYQKITIDNGRIEITVSNRGLRLRDAALVKERPSDERRGWGLKLMETLMDEVKIEDVDDGTRISMVKYTTEAAAEK